MECLNLSRKWMHETGKNKYIYGFSWLGRQIIQYPQDTMALQEIIWKVKPNLIIETGIAHGGSIIFSASMLSLLGSGFVIGIDIDIREHNRKEIENHILSPYIIMIEGDSTDLWVIEEVSELAKDMRVLVCLDSNHTHKHVLEELRAYAPLVSVGSYCVVMDTCIEHTPEGYYPDREWGKGNNPWTATQEFLKDNDMFKIDREIEEKLLITAAPDGYLKRLK